MAHARKAAEEERALAEQAAEAADLLEATAALEDDEASNSGTDEYAEAAKEDEDGLRARLRAAQAAEIAVEVEGTEIALAQCDELLELSAQFEASEAAVRTEEMYFEQRLTLLDAEQARLRCLDSDPALVSASPLTLASHPHHRCPPHPRLAAHPNPRLPPPPSLPRSPSPPTLPLARRGRTLPPLRCGRTVSRSLSTSTSSIKHATWPSARTRPRT